MVPPAEAAQQANTRRRAFSVVAPQLWNALTLEVHLLALSLLLFWKLVKTVVLVGVLKLKLEVFLIVYVF